MDSKEAKSERFELRLEPEVLQKVDAWRKSQEGLPSRSEAVRRLIERGLPESTQRLSFTNGETLLIHLMADVIKSLKVKSGIDPDFLNEALFGGHLWALEWEHPYTFATQVDNPHTVQFVVDTLDMWDLLESAYERLDKKEKARVELEAEPFGKSPKFGGFDGNNEGRHMSIARFMVEKMGRWPRFKNREMNAHHPTLETHARMLAVFLPMRSKLAGGSMSVVQIIAVLNEKTHPTMRKK